MPQLKDQEQDHTTRVNIPEAPSAEEYTVRNARGGPSFKKQNSRKAAGIRSRSPLSFASVGVSREPEGSNRNRVGVQRIPSSRSRSRGRSKSVDPNQNEGPTQRRSVSRGRQGYPSTGLRPNSPTRVPSPEPTNTRRRLGVMRRAASPTTPCNGNKNAANGDSPTSVIPNPSLRAASPLTVVGGRHVVPKRPMSDIRSPGDANGASMNMDNNSSAVAKGPSTPIPDFCAQTDAYGRAAGPRSMSPGMMVRQNHPGVGSSGQDSSALVEQSPSSSDDEGGDGGLKNSDQNLIDTLRMMCCCLLTESADGPSSTSLGSTDKKRRSKKGKASARAEARGKYSPSSVRTDGTNGSEDEDSDDHTTQPGTPSGAHAVHDHDDGIPPGLLPKVRHPDDLLPDGTPKKCLVLDLDETLVHSSFRAVPGADFVIPVQIEDVVHFVYVAKRPGVDEFLLDMARYYEIVVYTASLNKYADPLLDLLDPHRVIRYRLFRESCVYYEGNYVKDLSVLGRDLRHSIIVDNSPSSYIFHPENAIDCSSFIDDPKDRELDQIGHFCIGAKDLPVRYTSQCLFF
mmetsp:Transcript_29445/g.67715  ORF Transcript_29445/g.67715 Transcript_29445/m.67715 type:complete len:568 (-) Transcript_29445:606-2309(-)